METERMLVACGTWLLTISALLGFVQHAYREEPARFARWRVVHAGGTVGAVQLLGLGAAWRHFSGSCVAKAVAAGVLIATFAFFLGPLARATGYPRVADRLLALGAFVAVPAYLGLPLALAFRR